jgi:hypothetical protein
MLHSPSFESNRSGAEQMANGANLEEQNRHGLAKLIQQQVRWLAWT